MCSEFHRGQKLPSFNKRPDICMQLSFEVEQTLPCNAGRSIYVTVIDRNSNFRKAVSVIKIFFC